LIESLPKKEAQMAKSKLETTQNKRAGIFYGPSDGHPIIWNNDWNNLIQREVAAR
jgi:hypothetical protein